MRTVEWRDGVIVTVDQSRLPHETAFLELRGYDEVAEAIKAMKVRGAPLLGVIAAYGLALVAHHSKARTRDALISELEDAANVLRLTRPTAANITWALDRVLVKAKGFGGEVDELVALVIEEAERIAEEDVKVNRLIGELGAELLNDGDVVLTHCNAGALATAGYGTALGVVRAAWERGKRVKVIVTETRPKLQGARLTTYELKRDGIPVTLITDNMVGYVMYGRKVDKVLVGADRVVRDAVINKIGTYVIAVLAREHGVPFYVVAPKSSFDLDRTSSQVTIEERGAEEVTFIGGERVAPEGVDVLNPAFDVTPLKYVTAIVCEDGIMYGEDFNRISAHRKADAP